MLGRWGQRVERFGVLVAGEEIELDIKIVEKLLDVVIGLMRGGDIANDAVRIRGHDPTGRGEISHGSGILFEEGVDGDVKFFVGDLEGVVDGEGDLWGGAEAIE